MATRPDVVLINPCSRPRVYQSLGASLTAVENPVWAGLMATFCRLKGLSVEIIDAEADGLTDIDVADRVKHVKPVLAAVVAYGHQPSASTQIMTAVGDVCRAIKESRAEQKVLLLGGHVAALPERTLEEEAADFVAAGEGLYTLVALAEALKSPNAKYSGVPGLWYRDNGTPRLVPGKPLITNLDGEMPGVAWDLLSMSKYRAHNWHCLDGRDRQPYAAIYTTLGCPYHCSFCCIQAPFKSGEEAAGIKTTVNSYRSWSVDRVVDQIDTLVQKYGVRNIKIADEMFVLNRRHVLGICDRIVERGYNLNIWAYTRIDTIKDGMVEKLKAAGFNWLAIGIESGAERVRADVDKGFDQDNAFRVIRDVRSAGINVIGNYIFGLPEDDYDTMQATLDMAIDLNCEFANFYSAMAYPGSPLYSLAVQQGLPLPQSWTGYSQHSRDSLPLPTRYLTAREVLKFRDAAFQTYYAHPRYLGMLSEKFGPDVVRNIRDMTEHRLERDLLMGKLEVSPKHLPIEVPSRAAKTVEVLTLSRR